MLFKKPAQLNILAAKEKGQSPFKFSAGGYADMWFGHRADDTFLYWTIPLTKYHLTLRRWRRWLGKLQVLGGLTFGFGLLGFFIWLKYTAGAVDQLITYTFWFETSDPSRSLFWLSLIAFTYVGYRLFKPKRFLETLSEESETAKRREEKRNKQEVLPAVHSWKDVKSIPRKKRRDISKIFTPQALRALEQSYSTADQYSNSLLVPEHVFYTLLSDEQINGIFIRLGINIASMKSLFLDSFKKRAAAKQNPHLSYEVLQMIFHAYVEAQEANQQFVHVTELLLTAVQQSEQIQELLYELEVDKEKLANVIAWVRIRETLHLRHQRFRKAAAHRSKHGIDRAMTAVATPFLNRFSQDITLAAKFGHLEPCVTRDDKIDEIFRIIEGGQQSVVLVGELGVGKMAIIEGIAQLMVEERVPERLKEKRLVQLSTSALLAGTTTNGAIERLRQMMHEIAKARNVILFINNLHDLVSGGGDSKGLDVSEALAEFASKGAFLTLATTTVDGYNRNITNSPVGSAFARVDINEMEENQAIQVLESKAGFVEYQQKVFFSYDALAQAVKLSDRFLHDQNMPESAISIMAEAAAFTRSQKGENQLVTGNDVATVISRKTGIPTTSISENESDKLLRLEDAMHKRVIGQDEAVVLVANALRRARAEIRSTKRPIANFLFLGPTGVGKTELAKTIADIYFGGEDRMIRIDMSEFQDKSSIYRLIGQPGQQGTGILTEAVRQQPFSLVLLDEMEKADPGILTLFLQVFDDGRLTDSVGRVIDFTNSIIISTSNAGTQYVADRLAQGAKTENIRQELIKGELKKYYRPEFLNRFDGIVLFKALEREQVKKIAGLMLRRVAKDLEMRGVLLEVTNAALESLAQVGFDPEFGARPMRRAIQDHVENKLAELILANKLKRNDTVILGKGISINVRGK